MRSATIHAHPLHRLAVTGKPALRRWQTDFPWCFRTPLVDVARDERAILTAILGGGIALGRVSPTRQLRARATAHAPQLVWRCRRFSGDGPCVGGCVSRDVGHGAAGSVPKRWAERGRIRGAAQGARANGCVVLWRGPDFARATCAQRTARHAVSLARALGLRVRAFARERRWAGHGASALRASTGAPPCRRADAGTVTARRSPRAGGRRRRA